MTVHTMDLFNLSKRDKHILLTYLLLHKPQELKKNHRWQLSSKDIKSDNLFNRLFKSNPSKSFSLNQYLLKFETKQHLYYFVIDPSLLGGGGYGRVYRSPLTLKINKTTRTMHLLERSNIAKKLVFTNQAMFLREYRHLKAVEPKTAKITIDDQIHPNKFWLITKEIKGKNLFSMNLSTQSPSQKFKMALSLIVELMKLHDKNVYGGVHIHNDIKPENIMITEEGLARFIDFGLSSDKKEPFIGGTSAYLSPEFFNYVQRPSPRPYKSSKVSHDIYSLGLVLFQIFMELPPFFDSFPAKSDKAKRWNHRQPYYTNGPIIKVVTDIYTTKPQPNGIFIIDAEIEGLGPNDAREVFKLIHAMLKKDPMKRITLDQLHSKLLEIAKTVDGFEETPEIQLALDVSPS